MATKQVSWDDGSGDYITLTYQGQGSGPVTAVSPENRGAARSKVITIETTAGSPVVTKTVTISQAAMPTYVDLGLPSGLLWAKGNIVKDSQGNYSIGAETDWGTYVSWGNIDGHNEGERYNFSSNNYSRSPGYSVSADIPNNDAAHDICLARLGAPWRLPTKKNFQELYNNTDSEWATINGVVGRKFMKKSNNSVYVFFPASGLYGGETLNNRGTDGLYWSSSFYSSSNAYRLSFDSSSAYPQNNNNRRFGCTIRPVCKLIFSITITLTGDSVSGIIVTVTDSDGISHSGTTNSNGVVQLTGVVSGSAKVSASGYGLTNNYITVNASSRSFTCGLVPLGIWAYYSDGTLKSESEADSSAIGVAVITSNCAFVIDKNKTNGDNLIKFGGYNKDLTNIGIVTSSNSSVAKLDFDGNGNTTKIITALSGYNDGYSTGAPACEACRAAFSGQGYMGSLGEWNEAYTNKSSVNSMMTKIGGNAITANDHWASTIYSIYGPWRINWSNGATDYGTGRYDGPRIRAFRPL